MYLRSNLFIVIRLQYIIRVNFFSPPHYFEYITRLIGYRNNDRFKHFRMTIQQINLFIYFFSINSLPRITNYCNFI